MTSNSEKQAQYADMPPVAIAENVLAEIKNGHLLITIDLTQRKARKGTGKSRKVGHS